MEDKDLKRYIISVGRLTPDEIEKFMDVYKKTMNDLLQLFTSDPRMKEYLGL